MVLDKQNWITAETNKFTNIGSYNKAKETNPIDSTDYSNQDFFLFWIFPYSIPAPSGQHEPVKSTCH
jgi:hypothetical protein